MLFKPLTVVTLFSAVLAAPEPAQNVEKRQMGQAVPADVGALVSLIPASVLTAFLANPSGAESSILAQVQAGSPPGWITSLPTPVQQSLAAAFGVTGTGAPATAVASATSRLSQAVSAASSRVANITSSAGARASQSPFVAGVSNSTAGNSTALTGAQSSILANSSNAASSIAASVSNAASSAGASASAGDSSAAGSAGSAGASSTSAALAPRETGAMALGLGAIVGVLGLAAAL